MHKILLIAAIALLTGATIMPVQAQQTTHSQTDNAAQNQQKASLDAKDTAPRKKKIAPQKRQPKLDHMTQADKDRKANFMAHAKARHQEFKNRAKVGSNTIQKKPMYQNKKGKIIPQAQ